MPSRFNPFQQWLGIDSTRPSHYELLGCSPDASPDEIRQAAERQLRRLKKIDPGPRGELMKKLTRRIKVAYRVLSDPKQRQAYDQKLHQTDDDEFSVTASETAKFSQTGIYNADKTSSDLPLPLASPAADHDDDIPMAIPLTNSTDSETGKSQTSDQASNQSPDQSSDPSEEVIPPIPVVQSRPRNPKIEIPGKPIDSDDVSLPPGLHVKPRRGRRPTWLIPVTTIALFAIGVAGLVYFFLNFPSSTENQKKVDPGELIEGENGAAPPAATDDGPDKTPLGSSADLDRPVPDGPETAEVEDEPADRIKSPMVDPAGEGEHLATNVEDNDGETSGEPDEDIADTETGDDASTEGFDNVVQPDVTTPPLTSGAKFLLAALVERAYLAIHERNDERARRLAQQIVQIAQVPGQPPQEDRQQWLELASAITETTVRLGQFWEQVRSSASSAVQNDRDIPFNDTRFAIVEADDQHVMLRTGENRTFQYNELPAGLAMAIGDSGEKANLPEWYIQKAAFYAAHLQVDPKYRDRAREFMELARNDGYDVEFLQTFLEGADLSALSQLESPGNVARQQLDDAMSSLAAEFSLPEPLSRLPVRDGMRKMAEIEQWLSQQPTLPASRAAAATLWLSRLAAEVPDVEAAFNYHRIASSIARTDAARDHFQMLRTMLAKNPASPERERILYRAVVYLRSPLAAALRGRERRQFVNDLRRSVDATDSTELRRLIESLER